MADFPALAARLFNRPHLVTPAYAETVCTALAHRLRVKPMLSADELEIVARPARTPMMHNGIMVLPLVGGMHHRGSEMAAMSGSQSYTNIQNQLVEAMKNPDIKGILLDVDSPGGQASGCFELADIVLDARERKPIWSIANAMACSAAYALASSATRFHVTPSAEVGSIGVVLMHADYSAAVKEAGVVVTYIYAGKHKVDGNPYEPLPASVKADLQEEVDYSYERFVSLVAARRPGMAERDIRKTEARSFNAEKAVDLGLADEMASFDAVLTAFSRELNAPKYYQINRNGALRQMSDNVKASGEPVQIAGLKEALEAAKTQGIMEAKAEVDRLVVDAYTRGRQDAAKILGSPEAKGREAAAANFAGLSKFSVEEATAMLGLVAKSDDGVSAYREQLKAEDPKVPASSGSKPQEASDAVSSFQSNVSGHLAKILKRS